MRSKTMILVALLLASFLINLDTTLVNVALPTLTRELGATTSQLQWVVDAYNLVFAALLLTSGSLSDRFGRKGLLLAGLAVFGLASFAGGYATSPAGLIAARAVMGLGAALTLGALTAYQVVHVTPSGAPISELPLALVPTVGVPLLFAVHITSVTALARATRTAPPAAVRVPAAAE